MRREREAREREKRAPPARTLPTLPDPLCSGLFPLSSLPSSVSHPFPSHSYTTTPPPSPSTPHPFGFRRFKGHKHDREAAARRAATAVALQGMAARIADHRAARRAIVSGASPLDQLLSRPKELRLKSGRGVAPGPPKK